MFMHIVTQLSGRITALFTQALVSLKALLCKLVNNLRVNITRVYQNVVSLCRLAVQTMLNIKVLLVPLITAVQSIKVALISVKARVLPLGQLLLTIVHQTKQAAPTAPSPKRGRPVGVTKSARSRSKKNKTAQTPTAPQSTLDGLKSVGLVKQLLQRAKQLLKAKA
jgi:hypothetical protein